MPTEITDLMQLGDAIVHWDKVVALQPNVFMGGVQVNFEHRYIVVNDVTMTEAKAAWQRWLTQ